MSQLIILSLAAKRQKMIAKSKKSNPQNKNREDFAPLFNNDNLIATAY